MVINYRICVVVCSSNCLDLHEPALSSHDQIDIGCNSQTSPDEHDMRVFNFANGTETDKFCCDFVLQFLELKILDIDNL